MVDTINPGLKDKNIVEIPEGCPAVISISTKVICNWINQCSNRRTGYEGNVCVNYDPANIDYKNDSLKCANWSNPNAIHKERSNKKVLQRRPRRKNVRGSR